MSIKDLPENLIDDIRFVMEGKKLDPVGKADADIDNDGDTDSSDEYLHKRRKAIGQAMKKEGNKFTLALSNAKEKGEKSFMCAGKKYTVQDAEEYEKELKSKEKLKEKEVKEDLHSDKPEKKDIVQTRKDMQKSVDNERQKLKDLEQRKKERLRKMQKIKEHLMPVIEEFGVEMISEIIGNVRIPDAGKDSSGIRKAVGKDSDGGMDNKEKVGYNAIKGLAKRLYKAMDDEQNANNEDQEERARDLVIKLRKDIESKSRFYKDATVKKAKADARG